MPPVYTNLEGFLDGGRQEGMKEGENQQWKGNVERQLDSDLERKRCQCCQSRHIKVVVKTDCAGLYFGKSPMLETNVASIPTSHYVPDSVPA